MAFVVISFARLGAAHADPLDKTGVVVIGLDRVVPVLAFTHDRIGSRATNTAYYGNAPGTDTPYNVPRLGLDAVAFHHVTLGAATSLRIDTGSPSSVVGADPRISLFAFTPRIGYVAQVAPEIAFWPRAGLALSEMFTRSDAGGVRSSDLRMDAAASFEVSLVATPIPMLGITMTLGTELPIVGRTVHSTPASTEVDSTARFHAVIDAGLIAHFF